MPAAVMSGAAWDLVEPVGCLEYSAGRDRSRVRGGQVLVLDAGVKMCTCSSSPPSSPIWPSAST